MKATYTKPVLAVELFSLTQTIARDCAEMGIPKDRLNLNDPYTCAWDMGGGMTVFVGDVNCVLDGQDMGYGCYNNPSEGSYVFRS